MQQLHVTHNSYSFSSKKLNGLIKLPSLPEIKSSSSKIFQSKLKVHTGHAKTLTNLDASIADSLLESNLMSSATESFAPSTGGSGPHKRYNTLSLRSMTSFDLAEENQLRKNKIESDLKELISFDVNSVLFKPEDYEGIYSLEMKRRRKLEGQKKVFRLFEQILCLYELKFHIVVESFSDSFLGVDAINDNFALIDYIQILAPIISRFPYSFFRRVKFPVITFCDDYYLHKPNVNFGEARMLNKGFFPIKRFDSADKVIDHFMQILYINLKLTVPNFDARVMKVVQDTNQFGVVRSLTELAGTKLMIKKTVMQGEKPWRVLKTLTLSHGPIFSEDQLKSKKRLLSNGKGLIMNPVQALEHENEVFQQKAMLFRSFLEEVDPEGIDARWWVKLQNNELPSLKL